MDKEVAVSRLRKALGLLCGSLGAVCLLTISAQIVFAAAGDEGGVHGGGCAPDGYTGTYWDTCYGATWRYYSIPRDTGDVYIPGTSSGTVTGGTVSGCGQHGGYYRLALEKYNAGTGASLGEQIGLLQDIRLRKPSTAKTVTSSNSSSSANIKKIPIQTRILIQTPIPTQHPKLAPVMPTLNPNPKPRSQGLATVRRCPPLPLATATQS